MMTKYNFDKTAAFSLLILCASIFSCTPTNKTIIVSSKMVEYEKFYHPEVETQEIKYLSDNLKITGYIHKPKGSGPFPVVIYNRGGNRDFGTHSIKRMRFQREIASKGYVVLATQLRGNKFSEGEDEMGGKDLNDILRLIDVAKELDYADSTNIGAYGISRGGLNTYQLSRMTDEIKVIAVVGAPVNPRIDFDTRPKMYTKVFYPLVGDTITNKTEYDKRSPILWADEINEPTLILHGLDDWRVTPKNAQLMINAMEKLGHEFEYRLFEGGDHGLGTHVQERNDLVIAWFDRYLKNGKN